MNNNQVVWTADEDRLVIDCRSPKDAFNQMNGRHTYKAIRTRKYKLSHPEREVPPSNGPKIWTQAETKIVRDRYPRAKTTAELLPLLPRFTGEDIRNKASRMKIKRRFAGDRDVPVDGHKELVDQIRMRAGEDGIGLMKLDGLLGTRSYFRYNWKYRPVNLLAVARAIEFFGGTLVIDWRDR